MRDRPQNVLLFVLLHRKRYWLLPLLLVLLALVLLILLTEKSAHAPLIYAAMLITPRVTGGSARDDARRTGAR